MDAATRFKDLSVEDQSKVADNLNTAANERAGRNYVSLFFNNK